MCDVVDTPKLKLSYYSTYHIYSIVSHTNELTNYNVGFDLLHDYITHDYDIV